MFASRLKRLRSEKDITQRDLANVLGITQQAVGLYETGKRQPDPDALQKLADYFNVSIDFLLGRTNERKPGAGVKNIDDPEVLEFMSKVQAQFRMDSNMTEQEKRMLMEDMADYFKMKMEQMKRKKK